MAFPILQKVCIRNSNASRNRVAGSHFSRRVMSKSGTEAPQSADGARSSAATSGIHNVDAYERMNFLYQAAHAVLRASPPNPFLARFYISTMRNIAKRSVLRMFATQ
jgi:hypothetical protein